jgi:hypothetical protein
LNFDKYHCKNCYNGIQKFLSLPNLKQIFQKTCESTTLKNGAAQENLFKNGAAQENLINGTAQENLIKNEDPTSTSSNTSSNVFSAEFNQKDVDQSEIMAIKAELRGSLLSIASKLLRSEDTRLHHLSLAEQQLWNSFEKADIYEFLTGEKDTILEFQFNWISPEAPSIRLVPGASSTAAAQLPAPVAAPPPVQPAQVPPAPPPVAPPLPAQPAQILPAQQQPAPDPDLQPQPDQAPPTLPRPPPGGSDGQLCDRKPTTSRTLASSKDAGHSEEKQKRC